jgi:hypothetical protein
MKGLRCLIARRGSFLGDTPQFGILCPVMTKCPVIEGALLAMEIAEGRAPLTCEADASAKLARRPAAT